MDNPIDRHLMVSLNSSIMYDVYIYICKLTLIVDFFHI